MKTLQIKANVSKEDNKILKCSGIKRIRSGWYTVRYNGVLLDSSTVVCAKRNKNGEIKY